MRCSQKHKVTEFPTVGSESKRMDERNTNSTFRKKESTGMQSFSFIKTYCYHRAEVGKALGESQAGTAGSGVSQRQGVITGTDKSAAVITGSKSMAYLKCKHLKQQQ